jgi:autoinducer 2-degrading protein
MYVVCVTVHVIPESVDAFVRASLENAESTRREPGCARFDVLRATQDAAQFLFYEVYASEADLAAHQKTAHYLAWREKVAPMMASPRVSVRHESVSPEPWV